MRFAALWAGNPLLWLQLGSGAHVDVLAAALALAALAVSGGSRLGAGALAGLAASVKAPAGLVWLALVWTHRTSKRGLALLVLGAALVVIPGYAVAGTGALHQLSRA